MVAVWGCGPVGQFAIQSARLLGAERVIAIDKVPERLRLAEEFGGAETIQTNGDARGARETMDILKNMTMGRGPDVCIAVGMEAHGHGILGVYDRVMQSMHLETGRPHALRQAIQACRKGGRVSIPGVYGGVIDKVMMGAAFINP